MASNIISSTTPPIDLTMKWLDISISPAKLKYYNAPTQSWVAYIENYPPTINVNTNIVNVTDAITKIDNHIGKNEIHKIICTSLTRPVNAKHGQEIFETDTSLTYTNISPNSTPLWQLNGSGGGGVSTASQVTYSNDLHSDLTDVKKALDYAIEKATYVDLKINSFTNNINYTEVGSVINSITFNWNYNKTISAQSIDTVSVNVIENTYTMTGLNLTSDKTYTLYVTDDTMAINKTSDIKFLYKRYWGVSGKTTLNNAEILALGNSEFVSNDNKSTSKNFDCTGGRYIYVAYPSNINNINFRYNGINIPMVKTNMNFTNASNGTTEYSIYRSYNLLNNNSITIDIV